MTAALVLACIGLAAMLRYEGLDRTKVCAARACSKALAAYARSEALRRRGLVRRLAERAERIERRQREQRATRATAEEARFLRSEAWERWAATWSLELAAWLDVQARLADPLPLGQLPADGETFDLVAPNREGVE